MEDDFVADAPMAFGGPEQFASVAAASRHAIDDREGSEADGDDEPGVGFEEFAAGFDSVELAHDGNGGGGDAGEAGNEVGRGDCGEDGAGVHEVEHGEEDHVEGVAAEDVADGEVEGFHPNRDEG